MLEAREPRRCCAGAMATPSKTGSPRANEIFKDLAPTGGSERPANLSLATLVASGARGATGYEPDRLPNAESSPNRPSAHRCSIMIATLGKNQLRSDRDETPKRGSQEPGLRKSDHRHRLLRVERPRPKN